MDFYSHIIVVSAFCLPTTSLTGYRRGGDPINKANLFGQHLKEMLISKTFYKSRTIAEELPIYNAAVAT